MVEAHDMRESIQPHKLSLLPEPSLLFLRPSPMCLHDSVCLPGPAPSFHPLWDEASCATNMDGLELQQPGYPLVPLFKSN